MIVWLSQLPPARRGLATVGDTVWIEVPVKAPAGTLVRPQPWDLGELAQVLGPGELISQDAGMTLRYPVAFWVAGNHPVTVPGAVVVQPNGQSDTLPAQTVTVSIASLLPPKAVPNTLAPKPAATVVNRADRSLLPAAVLEVLVLVAAGLLWWRARRRARPVVAVLPSRPPSPEPPLTLWAEAGEPRAALRAWQRIIRRFLDQHPDVAASGDAAPLLEAIERVEYGPASGDELARLLKLASRWITERTRPS
jgi:hypothetical protein